MLSSVNTHSHCIISSLKLASKMSTLLVNGKISVNSSHSNLYSVLLTLLYIPSLLTQLGCVCLSRFWLFRLCIFVFWFSCFAGTARLSQYSHISFLANKEIRRQHLYKLDPKSTKSTIIQMQKTLQTICRAC